MKSKRFDWICLAVLFLALCYFGGHIAALKLRRTIEAKAMSLKMEQLIGPEERILILANLRQQLAAAHQGDPQLWAMTLTELVNRPDNEFSISPARLGLLRRLYLKFRIPMTEV